MDKSNEQSTRDIDIWNQVNTYLSAICLYFSKLVTYIDCIEKKIMETIKINENIQNLNFKWAAMLNKVC